MLDEIIIEIKSKISDFREKNKSDFECLKKYNEEVIKYAGSLANSWSNSFAGWHGTMYYGNFEEPPINKRFSPEWGGIRGALDGWKKRSGDEVRQKIEDDINDDFLLDDLEKKNSLLKESYKKFHSEIIALFFSIEIPEKFDKENKILADIESFKLENYKNKFLKSNIPGTIMTRDANALSEGICCPAHLYYQAVGFESKNIIEKTDEFFMLCERLLTQLKSKNGYTKKTEKEPSVNNNEEPRPSINDSLSEQLRLLNKPLFISNPDHINCKEWISKTTATVLRFDRETGVHFEEKSRYIDDKSDESVRKNYLNAMEGILRNAHNGIRVSDLRVEIEKITSSQKWFDEVNEDDKIGILINEINNIDNKEKCPNLISHQLRTILRLVLIHWWEKKVGVDLEENEKNYLKYLIEYSIKNGSKYKKQKGLKIKEELEDIKKYKTLTDRLIHDEKTTVKDFELMSYVTNLRNIISYCFEKK